MPVNFDSRIYRADFIGKDFDSALEKLCLQNGFGFFVDTHYCSRGKIVWIWFFCGFTLVAYVENEIRENNAYVFWQCICRK